MYWFNNVGGACEDGTNSNCSECKSGYFYYQNTCYDVCPEGMYGDIFSYTCKPCHQACTKWFGGAINEWTACDSSLKYKLSGTTWNSVSCLSGQYLNLTDLDCYEWDGGWRSCEFPLIHYCNKCDSVHKALTAGTCTHWDSISGYEINSFGVWVETWGDGLNFGEYECDDANLLDGDGWSSTCQIEEGYICPTSLCREIVKPSAIVSKVSQDNICTVTFSETVIIANFTTFEQSLKAVIYGPKFPYKFKYRIYDPADLTKTAENLNKIQIQIYDILAPIKGDGSEKVEFWFEDSSVIKDLSDNIFAKGKFNGKLRFQEYVTESKY